MPLLTLRPLATGLSGISVGKRGSSTVVRGIQPSAFQVGKRQANTSVRGISGLSSAIIGAPWVEPPFAITSCGSVGEELYEALRPLAAEDAAHDYALWKFVCAIGGMLQDVEDLTRDQGPVPGWSTLMSAEQSPSYALDWLGQFVGVKPLASATLSQKRDRVADKEGFNRGSPSSLVAAARLYLIGNKTVNLSERDTSPYHLSVTTYTSETPDSSKVLAALMGQKPAGLVLTYSTLPGQSWGQLKSNHPTWANVKSFYATWNSVRNDTP